VKDTLEAGLDARAEPHIYHASMPNRSGVLVLRAQGNPKIINEAVREEILRLDKGQSKPTAKAMTEILADSVAERRFQTLLLGLFSGIALLLAATGLYGLMAYAVNQSTREIGVRMALGAQRGDVLKEVIGEGAKLVIPGLLFGALGAVGSTRFVAH